MKRQDKRGALEFRFVGSHETLRAEGRSSGSTIESIAYFSRRPRLDSQLPHSSSQPVTPVPGDPIPSSGLCEHYMHEVPGHTWKQNGHTYKMKMKSNFSEFFFLQVVRLAGWSLAQKASLSLFPFLITFSINQDSNLNFLLSPFSSDCKFCIFFSSNIFSWYIYIRVVTNNHVTQWVLGCFEISFAKKKQSKLFNSASRRFIGQERKAAIFFDKIFQELSLIHLLVFWNIYSASKFQIMFSTLVFLASSSMGL